MHKVKEMLRAAIVITRCAKKWLKAKGEFRLDRYYKRVKMAFTFNHQMTSDSLQTRAVKIFYEFMKEKSAIDDLKDKILSYRAKTLHVMKRFSERKMVLELRQQILKDLFMEERRFMIESLSQSKKKTVKELVKKLHELDRPGTVTTLDKAVAYLFKKSHLQYKERFNAWRHKYYSGGVFLQEMSIPAKGADPILDSI